MADKSKDKARNKLNDLLNSLNKDIEKSKDFPNTPPSISLRKSKREDNIFDDYDSFRYYKNFMLIEITREVRFKRKLRKWSLIIFAIILILMLINLIIMLYAGGIQITKNIAVPKFDTKVILAMITVTFANIFAIITLVFKYLFRPTSELMNHAKDMNSNNYLEK